MLVRSIWVGKYSSNFNMAYSKFDRFFFAGGVSAAKYIYKLIPYKKAKMRCNGYIWPRECAFIQLSTGYAIIKPSRLALSTD